MAELVGSEVALVLDDVAASRPEDVVEDFSEDFEEDVEEELELDDVVLEVVLLDVEVDVVVRDCASSVSPGCERAASSLGAMAAAPGAMNAVAITIDTAVATTRFTGHHPFPVVIGRARMPRPAM